LPRSTAGHACTISLADVMRLACAPWRWFRLQILVLESFVPKFSLLLAVTFPEKYVKDGIFCSMLHEKTFLNQVAND
jgi:hypothetical protein